MFVLESFLPELGLIYLLESLQIYQCQSLPKGLWDLDAMLVPAVQLLEASDISCWGLAYLKRSVSSHEECVKVAMEARGRCDW